MVDMQQDHYLGDLEFGIHFTPFFLLAVSFFFLTIPSPKFHYFTKSLDF
jgi:hypothetical protein